MQELEPVLGVGHDSRTGSDHHRHQQHRQQEHQHVEALIIQLRRWLTAVIICFVLVTSSSVLSWSRPIELAPTQSAANQSCDVLRYGAMGSGADDTDALQAVLDNELCAEVVLPSGSTLRATELFVRRDNIVLVIERNATLAGLPVAFRATRPDCATETGLEFNWTTWCALIRVTSSTNFTLRGAGRLAPGGVGGASPDFYSALHVQSTSRVALSGVRVHCTAWWWCVAMHNATDVVVSDGFFLDGRAGRDGIDFVNCRRVLVENARIEGSDDALCFKTISNGGLSRHPSRDVVVRHVLIGSTWCNGVQFGSATEVDMHNFSFHNVRVRFARKAAISIVSMDGANISAISFRNVSIEGKDVATPLYIKVGHRADCEDGKGTCGRAGSIRDINLTDIRAVGWGNVRHAKPGHRRSYTATIEGLDGGLHSVGALRLSSLTLVAPGGGDAADARREPLVAPLSSYQPRFDGVRPSYGLFLRHARDVTLEDSTFSVAEEAHDGRPAIVLDDVHGVTLSHVSFPVPRAVTGAPTTVSLSGTFDGVGARPPLCRAIEARNTSGVKWRAEGSGAWQQPCAWVPHAPDRGDSK